MTLRIVIADDERPARMFLKNLIADFAFCEIVGEAEDGAEAIELIEQLKPDLALLDLQMPQVGGLEVVKNLNENVVPLVAFVTAFDEFAVQAFELNAVDYLLKPVESERLSETLHRAAERLENAESRTLERRKLENAVETFAETARNAPLERIPIRRRDEILLLPVRELASIVADGELLHLTTKKNEHYTINFRLKDLEARLDEAKFIRLSRGALANVEMIDRIAPLSGGTLQVFLKNGQEITASRLQTKILRERLLKL